MEKFNPHLTATRAELAAWTQSEVPSHSHNLETEALAVAKLLTQAKKLLATIGIKPTHFQPGIYHLVPTDTFKTVVIKLHEAAEALGVLPELKSPAELQQLARAHDTEWVIETLCKVAPKLTTLYPSLNKSPATP
jgi:Xaa-Pro aminopeptidase